ncbi:DUF4956 domain-containing protein [Paraoerskovia sediminicola]|uniref:DUF4956 domain-containing protein n=1 Tax=Paraoerskovia sediminicola TaxID=1138587 RepID=A0ABN6X9X1_9CELL|nr:DUF4956 domain-containing protein [Paraoerskovia sediminicola]BDZ41653.1 DUF4956 domain-containing protein [Paraoerskovia sediminicola]
MTHLALFVADLVAISLLAFGVYFPRHRRRDLVVAYVGLNVGVLAVAGALSSASIGAGVGLGLFGVLSIIRLRSSEIAQHEVAYYFSALALGLLGGLGGLGGLPVWLAPVLMAAIVVVMFVVDHPRLLGSYRSQTMLLDTAITDEVRLTEHLAGLLGGQIRSVTVQRVDLVNDTTLVAVRFQVPEGRTTSRGSGRPVAPEPRVRYAPGTEGLPPVSAPVADGDRFVGTGR